MGWRLSIIYNNLPLPCGWKTSDGDLHKAIYKDEKAVITSHTNPSRSCFHLEEGVFVHQVLQPCRSRAPAQSAVWVK